MSQFFVKYLGREIFHAMSTCTYTIKMLCRIGVEWNLRAFLLAEKLTAGAGRLNSTHIVFSRIFNFQRSFPSSTVAIAGGKEEMREATRESPFTRRILRGIFLCRQIGLLRARRARTSEAHFRENRVFSRLSTIWEILHTTFCFRTHSFSLFSLSFSLCSSLT